MIGLTLAALVAAQPAPAWPALTTAAVAALREEGLSQADYARLAAGEVITQRRETPADTTGVRVAAFAVIPGTQAQVFDVVADCAKQPEFMPNFVACEAVTPDHPLPPNERWNLNKLEFGVFPLKFKIAIVQHAKLYPPERLTWNRVSGDTKVSKGYWRVIPLAPGVNVLAYDTIADPGTAVPAFVQRAITEHSLPETVRAVRRRVEALYGLR